MRDIAAYYKEGHLRHATAATHRGVPLPIGKDSESAKPSEYDTLRLERRKNTLAAQEKEKKGEEEQRRQEREADSATAQATVLEPEPDVAGGKQLKKRASAGKRRAATEMTAKVRRRSTCEHRRARHAQEDAAHCQVLRRLRRAVRAASGSAWHRLFLQRHRGE